MKTLEFKLNLNQAQQARVNSWMRVQNWVWNQGLELLKEFELFAHYNKHDKAYAPCCPIGWEYRWQKNDDGSWLAIPFSSVAIGKGSRYRLCCPIKPAYKEPRLKSDSKFSLTPHLAYRLHQDKLWLLDCPYKITQATTKTLMTAWQEYRKGKRKIPLFKGKHNGFTSISDTQSGNATINGNLITLPKLGKIRVKTLDERWISGLPVLSYRIVARPSGYYLFLVGDLPEQTLKPSDKACGIDPGVVAAVSLDNGRQFKPAMPLANQAKRLQRLQRKASRQTKGSNGHAKTQAIIARSHEKIKRSRAAFNHKLSTKIVREYGAISIEDTQLTNMVRKPKAKPRKDGKGYEHNNAKAKAGLNKSLVDVAIGDIRTKIESKAKHHRRETIRTPAQNSSKTCHLCGTLGDRVSQSVFRCINPDCKAHGIEQNADANAAKNHLLASGFLSSGKYRAWAWELKREETVASPSSGTSPVTAETLPAGMPPEGSKSKPSKAKKIVPPMPEHGIQSLKPPGFAQTTSKKPIQLTIWDAALAIDNEAS